MAASKVLVVGSGVIGLRTAQELLSRHMRVILRSSSFSDTCSAGAGGLWMPYKCDDERVGKWSSQTLDELLHDYSVVDSAPIEVVTTIFLKCGHSNYRKDGGKYLPEWTKDPRLNFQCLTIEKLWRQNQDLQLRIPSEKDLLNAEYTHAWLFNAPVVDPPRMLINMMNEVINHPLTESTNVEMDVAYDNLEEIVRDAKRHGCDSVINCAGLGAARICNDSTLKGGRGTLLHYTRSCPRREFYKQGLKHDACILTEEGKWGEQEPCYIIPRGNMLVIGGSYNELSCNELDEKHRLLRGDERQRLEKNAWTMGIDTVKAEPCGEWVGFRPTRGVVCLEVDNRFSSYGVKVVHSYGTGGSGWTVYSGVAKEAVNLLL